MCVQLRCPKLGLYPYESIDIKRTAMSRYVFYFFILEFSSLSWEYCFPCHACCLPLLAQLLLPTHMYHLCLGRSMHIFCTLLCRYRGPPKLHLSVSHHGQSFWYFWAVLYESSWLWFVVCEWPVSHAHLSRALTRAVMTPLRIRHTIIRNEHLLN